MTESDDDYTRYTTANIPAYLLRCVAATMADLGVDPARLCLGLGFTIDDLTNPACRVSFRQGGALIRRTRVTLGRVMACRPLRPGRPADRGSPSRSAHSG